MGTSDEQLDCDDMSKDSFQSVSSAGSSSAASSLQDIELAETTSNPIHSALIADKVNDKSPTRQTGYLPERKKQSARGKMYDEFVQEMIKVRRSVTESTGMNQVVLCILVTEAAERFTYYGFRASLVLYFTQELKMKDTMAISVFAFTSYVANFTPIFGAVLGDGRWGRYRTIVTFGFIYWLGLIILTHAAYLSNSDHSQIQLKRAITYIGLTFICTGTGGLRPCVSIFGADQVNIKEGEGQEHKLPGSVFFPSPKATFSTNTLNSDEQEKVRSFFSFFSMCINVGAVASFVVIPSIKGQYGYGVAFLLPTVLMFLATLVFLSQRKNFRYRPNNPHGSSLWTTLRLCVWLLHNNLWSCKFISDKFPFMEPGPVPLPSFLPKSENAVVQGFAVNVDHDARAGSEGSDDHGSLSSMSTSTGSRSASPSISRERPQSGTSTVEGKSSLTIRSRSSRTSARNRKSSGLETCASSISSATSLHTSDRYLVQQLSDAARALNVLPIFSMLPCFWMLYDQQGSVWTLQASRMNLHGIIQPEQINVLNPMGLLLLIPLFDKLVYPALEKREIDVSPLRRMGWGMILASFAFFISGIVEYTIDYCLVNDYSPISVFWQIPQVCLMTVAEIFISVTGLEFAYSVSPDRLKSFVMASYLMTVSKGDFWGGVLYSTVFRDMNQALVLHIFALVMIVNLAFYGYVVKAWELRHGLVSWDLFDKVLDNESRKRPCWQSHQRQYLMDAVPAGALEQSECSLDKQERGRDRWRRRGKKSRCKSRRSKSKRSKRNNKEKAKETSQSSSHRKSLGERKDRRKHRSDCIRIES